MEAFTSALSEAFDVTPAQLRDTRSDLVVDRLDGAAGSSGASFSEVTWGVVPTTATAASTA
jgi:hypothetical protein